MGLVASLCLTPVHAYYSNYSLSFREEHGLLGMRSISQRDCSAFGQTENSFCGDIVSAGADHKLDRANDIDPHSVPAQTPITLTALRESAPPPRLMSPCTARLPILAPQVKTAAGTVRQRTPVSAW